LRRVYEIHPWYDSLQYLVLFRNAEDGYSIYLRQVDPLTRLSLPTNPTVSAMNFYVYRIMVRDMNFNRIPRATTLFHQFLVHMYAEIEIERLNFIKRNQRQLRAENYIHLKDSVDREGAEREARDVGSSSHPAFIFHWLPQIHARAHTGCHDICEKTWMP
jgi:hypothetical protein